MQNAKCGMQNEALPRPAQHMGFGVHIRLDKEPGRDAGSCVIEGGSLTEKLYGVAVLVNYLGKASGLGTEKVLAKLATVLLVQEGGGGDE